MESKDGEPIAPTGVAERRHGERRTHLLRALFQGNLTPRRSGPRRVGDHNFGSVDWHHPQWLAIAILIVVLSSVDALLTLMLVERGAHEMNPFMARLIGSSGPAFALVKVGFTGAGVVLLTQLARMRAFGRVPVGVLLYGVLALYGALIAYEFSFLRAL